jgi:uncharacterized Zn-binding protein involved in type VI secretion
MSISTFGGTPIGTATSTLAIGQLVQALGGTGLIPLNGQVITASNYPELYSVISSSPKAVATSPMSFTSATGSLSSSGQWTGVYFTPSSTYLTILTNVAGTTSESSPDGLNWTPFPLPVSTTWYSIATSSTIAVAAGANGQLAYTTNGTTWTGLVLPVGGTAPTIMWVGSQFIWCDPTVMATFTSPDGINWTAQHIPGSGSNVGSWAKPYFIGGTSYIVPGVSTYALSTNNGSTWTSYSYPSVITANSSNNFAYNGSNLVMLAAETAVYTSPDGINWTAVTCPYTTTTNPNVYYVSGAFIVVSSAGAWYSTNNGSTWTQTNIPVLAGASTAFCNILAVGCNTAGTTVVGPVYGTSLAAVSTNSGSTWSVINLPVVGNWSICQWNGTDFVVLGDQSPYALQSPDGLNWTIVNSNVPTLPAASQFTSSTTNGSTMVVMCGNNFARTGGATTTCLTSPDNGTTWNTTTMPASYVWNSVAAAPSGGLFVATPGYNIYSGKQNGSTTAYAYSSDGINWTAGALATAADWAGVGYANGYFRIIGYGASTASYYSSTGTTWTAGTASAAHLNETITSETTGVYVVALATSGASQNWFGGTATSVAALTGSYPTSSTYGIGPACSHGNGFYYSNGSTITVQATSDACTAVTWTNNTKIASNGSAACFAVGNMVATWNSSTGLFSYQTVTGPAVTQVWLTPVWDGTDFVFMGANSTARYTSPDGQNFTYAVSGTSFSVDPAATNGTLVATVAGTGVYYSTNHGSTWTLSTFPYNEIPSGYMAPGVINGNFVVLVGLSTATSGAAVLTSTNNALSWTGKSPFISSGGTTLIYNGNSVAYNGSTVCASNPGTKLGLMTSLTGGSTWQASNIAATNMVFSVAYSAAAGQFFAWYNTVLTSASTLGFSPNGTTWSPQTTGNFGGSVMMGNVIFSANNYSTTSYVSAYGYANAPATTGTNQIYTTSTSCYSMVPNANTTQVLILPQNGFTSLVVSKTYNDATGVALPNSTPALGSLPWFIKAQ